MSTPCQVPKFGKFAQPAWDKTQVHCAAEQAGEGRWHGQGEGRNMGYTKEACSFLQEGFPDIPRQGMGWRNLPSLGMTERADVIFLPYPWAQADLSEQHKAKSGGQSRLHQAPPLRTLQGLLS